MHNGEKFLGKLALEGVPYLTILQGGLEVLYGIAEGKPEQVAV